ncbi:MAG: hypothetical protein HZB91_04310 [Elusimicrobia bacterium]|nr:hypothetical protein [Elusimicrobiota bacterium]
MKWTPSGTPFDRVIASVITAGYHNQRREGHSDIVSEGIFSDLVLACPWLSQDHAAGKLRKWLNVRAPGDRKRNIDLFVGEPQSGKAQLELVRFCCENKSVVTAHRNATNRFDDLTKILGSVHSVRPEAIIVATVMVGVSPRFLNVADRISSLMAPEEFEVKVRPRLSTGDESLFDDYPFAVSKNTAGDVTRTVAKFRELPLRQPGTTHVRGFDYLLLVPVKLDNVHPPSIARANPYGIDVDKDYERMINTICAAYRARWHSMSA